MSADKSTMKTLTAEDVARAIDPMGGIGHISGFTDEAQARRRAADLIRMQAAGLRTVRDAVVNLKAEADRKAGAEREKLNACGPAGNQAYADRLTFYEGRSDALGDLLALFVSPSGE